LNPVRYSGQDFFYLPVWNISTAASQWRKPPLLTTKNRLMISKTFINRLIILGFMGLVGYCLAKAIYSGSFMGILLALVALGAGGYFLYILAKAKEELDAEETTQ
jgi:hypothetical protein